MTDTADFFDEMAPRYDSDLVELGWDPVALLEDWPFVAPAGAAVLDAGCGTGAVLDHFAGANRALAGFDVSPRMVHFARQRRPLRSGRIHVHSADRPWPFEDAAFDRVIALAMFEFVRDLDVGLDELARVLRPNGRAIFTAEDVVDAHGIEREAHEHRYERIDLWRRTRDEVELCVPPGLTIERIERRPAYTVIERGFTCAYWVVEVSA